MMRNVFGWFRRSLVVLSGAGFVACGGDGGGGGPTAPPPGPPPPPPIGASLDLQPGEVRVLTDVASIRRFEIVGGADAREYQVIVMSAGETLDGLTPIRFRAQSVGSANVVPDRGDRRVGSNRTRGARVDLGAAADLAPAGLGFDRRASNDRHGELQMMVRDELRRVGARPARVSRARGASGVLSASRAGSSAMVPSVNDIVRITSAVTPGGGTSCVAETPIDGVVKTVGQNFVIIEDPAAAGQFTNADYQELDAELDDFVAPVTHAYFGTPADLDGNGRTIAFFTRQVNRLTPPGSSGIVIGFFSGIDISDPVACPSSNEAEIIWLIAPDPDGEDGPPVSISFVKAIARGLVAHEFQHLLNAQQRVTLGTGTFADTEDGWMNEGMSHIAEEISGFHRIGVGPRANRGYAELSTNQFAADVFSDFHLGNFVNMDTYLSSPTTVAALTVSGPDFATRGYGYTFLRWLGDRYGPSGSGGILPGSNEDALFRELSTGGPSHLFGIPNVLRAINAVSGESPSWGDVLSEYFAAPVADDAAAGPPSEVQFSTWDMPRLFEELASAGVLGGGYPLNPSGVSMGPGTSASRSFELLSSTAQYFRFVSTGAHPNMTVELTASSGANVPNGARARVIVVRTQ